MRRLLHAPACTSLPAAPWGQAWPCRCHGQALQHHTEPSSSIIYPCHTGMTFGLHPGGTGDAGIKGFTICPQGWLCKVFLPGGGSAGGWDEPCRTLPYRCAQKRPGSYDLRQVQGDTGFTANSLNTQRLQRGTSDSTAREWWPPHRCAGGWRTTTTGFAAAQCSGDGNGDVAAHQGAGRGPKGTKKNRLAGPQGRPITRSARQGKGEAAVSGGKKSAPYSFTCSSSNDSFQGQSHSQQD